MHWIIRAVGNGKQEYIVRTLVEKRDGSNAKAIFPYSINEGEQGRSSVAI